MGTALGQVPVCSAHGLFPVCVPASRGSAQGPRAFGGRPAGSPPRLALGGTDQETRAARGRRAGAFSAARSLELCLRGFLTRVCQAPKSRGSQRPRTPGPRRPAPRPSRSAPCGGQPWPCCREEMGGPRSLGHLWLLPSPALCLGTHALSQAPRPWPGRGFAGQGLPEGTWAGVGSEPT